MQEIKIWSFCQNYLELQINVGKCGFSMVSQKNVPDSLLVGLLVMTSAAGGVLKDKVAKF